MIDCIYHKNPSSGFERNHKKLCTCGAATTTHCYVGYWCGMLCANCAAQLQKTHRGAVLTVIKVSKLLPAMKLD
jgi:hypothetical protein